MLGIHQKIFVEWRQVAKKPQQTAIGTMMETNMKMRGQGRSYVPYKEVREAFLIKVAFMLTLKGEKETNYVKWKRRT